MRPVVACIIFVSHICQIDSIGNFFAKKPCDNGWIAYDESCYFIGRTIVGYREAQRYCKNLGGSLFVPDSLGEWDTIRPYATRALWSWIGIKAQMSRAGNIVARPEVRSDYNPENLPWLVTTPGHGYSTLIRCVSYFSSPDLGTAYVNYYDCNYRHFFICERNETLTVAGLNPWGSNSRQQIVTKRTTEAPTTTATTPETFDESHEDYRESEPFEQPQTAPPTPAKYNQNSRNRWDRSTIPSTTAETFPIEDDDV